MEKLLISACLLGANCRYDGKSKRALDDITLRRLMEKFDILPFCPEIYGGLPTPRVPSERRGDSYITAEGDDVSENYKRGACEGLRLAEMFSVRSAVLKARSPACGKGRIYDGSFSGTLGEGNGALAELLIDNGIKVYTEEEIEDLFRDM